MSDIDWNALSFTNKKKENRPVYQDERSVKVRPTTVQSATREPVRERDVRTAKTVTRQETRVPSRFKVDYKKGTYVAPPISLLRDYSADSIFTDADRVRGLAEVLQSTCNAFNIDARVTDVKATSLAITFTLSLAAGVSVKSITKLKADFELHLASEIEFSGYGEGKNSIQILAKNMNRPMIGLKSVMSTRDFEESESPLTVAAGVDVQGNPFIIDIAQAPHMLIAGTTGSGKSVFIDDILISILCKAKPEEVRLLLIDPKIVELNPYNNVPHLLAPVINTPEESLNSFMWVEDEMLRRYDTFSSVNVKHIDVYNSYAEKNGLDKLPRILIIVDEFTDLMLESPKETNEVIDRIARLGRAAGVHLILATQLPVAKIVTPQIKANIPCRASFTVVDGRESRIILDKTGAERLLGNGDMIFSQSEHGGSVHAQAAYVSETELWNIVNYIKSKN